MTLGAPMYDWVDVRVVGTSSTLNIEATLREINIRYKIFYLDVSSIANFKALCRLSLLDYRWLYVVVILGLFFTPWSFYSLWSLGRIADAQWQWQEFVLDLREFTDFCYAKETAHLTIPRWQKYLCGFLAICNLVHRMMLATVFNCCIRPLY